MLQKIRTIFNRYFVTSVYELMYFEANYIRCGHAQYVSLRSSIEKARVSGIGGSPVIEKC